MSIAIPDDVYCPYCGEGQEINHDDGYGYAEDEVYEQGCVECGMRFTFTTSISFYYEPGRAPCLNDGDHKFEPMHIYPQHWPDAKRCIYCDHEERGKYVELE